MASGKETFGTAFRRLLEFYRPDANDISVIIAYAMCTGVLSLAVPLAASSLVTTIAFGQLLQPLIVLSLFVFIGMTGAAVLKYLQVQLAELVQQRIFARVATSISVKLPTIEYDFFRTHHAPDMVNRFLEVVTVQKVTAQLLMEGVGVVFTIFMGLVLIAFYHPLLLAYGILLCLGIGFVFLLGLGATPTALDESSQKYNVLEWLEDLARFPILFKATWGENLALRRADELIVGYLKSRRKHFRILRRQFLGGFFVQAIGASALLVLGGWLVMIEELTLGQLVAAEIAVSSSVYSVSRFGKSLESVYDLLAAVTKLEHMLDAPSERHNGNVVLGDSGALEVVFENVSLSAEQPRAQPISLTVPAGAKICIFGRNASGKSTLANYVLKLRRPGKGVVKVNGMDVRDLNVESLRTRVHLVRGREVLASSIEENVACLRPQADTTAVVEALEKVGLLSFVQNLPDGLKTVLSPLGAPFSSGQLSQLMLARAIVGAPGVLILDETLDAIDPASLKKIYSFLLSSQAPWTLIDLTSDPVVWAGFEKHYRLSTSGLQLLDPGTKNIDRLSEAEES